MRDVNFFCEYKRAVNQKENGLRYFYGVLIIFAIFTVLSAGVDGVRIFLLTKKIDVFTEKLNEPSIQQELTEANNVNSEIDILNKYDAKVNEVSGDIKKRDNVSVDLFTKLNSKLPSDISFKSISVNANEVVIEGTSKSNDAVAEYEHNLKELKDVSTVFVETLDKSNSVEDEYSFKLNCVLKDVE